MSLRKAIEDTLKEVCDRLSPPRFECLFMQGKVKTRDLGGYATTTEYAMEIIRNYHFEED